MLAVMGMGPALPVAVHAHEGSFTAGATWEVPPNIRFKDKDAIWLSVPALHAFAGGEADGQHVLESVWHYDAAGWFPTWTFSLVGPEWLLPVDVPAVNMQDGRLKVDLATTSAPKTGHVYEITVSYDSVGWYGFQILDQTDGQDVAELGLTTHSGLRWGQPVVGNSRPEAFALLDNTLQSYFTPFGIDWAFRVRRPDDFTRYLSVSRPYVEPGDVVELELRTPALFPGEWDVMLATDAGATTLRTITDLPTAAPIPIITVTEALVGRHNLVLRYTEHEKVVRSFVLPIVAGRLFGNVDVPVINADTKEVRIPVQFGSTFTADAQIRLSATMEEIVWNGDTLRYGTRELPGITAADFWVNLEKDRLSDVYWLLLDVPKRSGSYRVNYALHHDLPTDVAVAINVPSEVIDVDFSETQFRVVTYNLWEAAHWPRREPALRHAIAELQPDILGVQELRAGTRLMLDDVLRSHERVHDAFYGWYDEGNIYWSTERFELVAYGAEDIGICEPYRRLFWVRLREMETSNTVLVATAHYTYHGHACMRDETKKPRVDMARNTVKTLRTLAFPDEPVIFMGDLNESGEAIDELREGGFIDAIGSKGEALVPTHPAHATEPARNILDWQFYWGPIRPVATDVVDFMFDGVVPSDHKPVLVTYGMQAREQDD